MWEFYLAGCQISFEDMPQMVFHLQIAKDKQAVPLTRDYLTEAWQKYDSENTRRSHAAE